MVHVNEEHTKAKQMLLASIEEQTKAKQMQMTSLEQANASIERAKAALVQLNATEAATKTMIAKKREKITAANPLYKKISNAILPGGTNKTTKENPVVLEGEDNNDERPQSESSSRYEQPKSKHPTLQAQLESRSVVEKPRLDHQRDQKRRKHPKRQESDDDDVQPSQKRKRLQKTSASQPPAAADEEDKEEEEEYSMGGSQLSSDRVNATTHAEKWAKMVGLINLVQQSIEPWTVLHGQTMLSKISANLKDFPGGNLFPSVRTLDQWEQNYRQSIPLPNCKSEAKHINDLIVAFDDQAHKQPKSPSYDCPSASQGSALEEEKEEADDDDDKVHQPPSIDQPTTRSESLGSPPLQSRREQSLTKPVQPPMTGTGQPMPIAPGKSKKGNTNVTPKVGAVPVEKRQLVTI